MENSGRGGWAVPDEQREMLSPAGRSAELLLRATGTELLEGRTKEGGEKPTLLHNESQSLAGSKSTSAKRTSAISSGRTKTHLCTTAAYRCGVMQPRLAPHPSDGCFAAQ